MKNMRSAALLLGLAVSAATSVSAAPVMPVSYDMPNGNTGSYNYWDDTYNGSGSTTTDGAALTGGVGDLTDGVIATDNWFVTEAPAGPGPYVGWLGIDPLIRFFFDSTVAFRDVTFFFDDSDGSGGVSQPASVSVAGVNHIVPFNPGAAPFSFTVDLTGLTADQVDVQIFRSNSWVFLSEVSFTDTGVSAVPVPASALMFMSGLGALGFAARRRRGRA